MVDTTVVDGARNAPRRIGTILVDRKLITADQLTRALVEQDKTGRPLGEICVERCGLDRLSLADALSEQWEEMQRAAGEPAAGRVAGDGATDGDSAAAAERAEADELRLLLEEAEAARAELASKTDELGRRLAVLETLVVGVSDALAEIRAVDPAAADGGQAARAAGQAARRPNRSRTGVRTGPRRAASS